MIAITYYFLLRENKKIPFFHTKHLSVSSGFDPPLVVCSFRGNGWAEWGFLRSLLGEIRYAAARDCISVLKRKPKRSLSPRFCFLLHLTTDEEVEAQSDLPEAFKVNVQRNREGLYATSPTYTHKTGETLRMLVYCQLLCNGRGLARQTCMLTAL